MLCSITKQEVVIQKFYNYTAMTISLDSVMCMIAITVTRKKLITISLDLITGMVFIPRFAFAPCLRVFHL